MFTVISLVPILILGIFLFINRPEFGKIPAGEKKASPLPNTMKSFPGSDVYTAGDIPEIDYLFITHDHRDHRDQKTMLSLKKKVKQIFTWLGVKDHLEHWGLTKTIIYENDWNQVIKPDPGFKIITVPARHFSGGKFKRNPEEVVQSTRNLNAEHAVLVHWTKFPLAQHIWNEPPARATEEAERKGVPLLTPMIGQAIHLNESTRDNRNWWLEI